MPLAFEWLLLALAVGAVPGLVLAWYRQRQQAACQADLVLAQERLQAAQRTIDTLGIELDAEREGVRELLRDQAEHAGELAALQRETELSRTQLQRADELERSLRAERQQLDNQLRELHGERARLQSTLDEQQQAHQQRLSDVQNARDELRAQFAELAGKIFDEREQRFSESSQQRLGQLLDPLKERIQAFEKRVDESYQQEARERFSLGKELQRLQTLNQRLGDEAMALTQALKGQKTQGNWGELVLERVLEHAGMVKGREYSTQVNLRSADGERFQPDVVISLPGERQVIVDAKVSLTAWQAIVSASDAASEQQLLRQHVLSLKNHVKGLSSKDYHRLDGLNSLDFVLLFVPIEAAFSAAIQAEPGLLQDAFDRGIVMVSPTTLLATLRLVDSLWKQERQTQNAREIAERAGWLYDKFVLFIQDLDEVGTRLQQVEKAYQGARGKLTEGRGNLINRAEQLKLLGARAGKSLPAEWLDRAAQDD